MGAMTNTKQLSVNGIDLVYDEAGSGPRAFVLVHGFTGGRSDFDTQLPPLSALGLTVAYDQRGHGDSTNTGDPKTYTFDQLALDLRGFADALALPRFDLLGHSMGGMVALRFTLAFPERVASLVLMDTASAPLQGGLPREAFEKGAAIGRAAGMGKLHQVLRARAADNPLRSPADRRLETELGDAYWERGRRKLTSMDPEAFEALGRALGEGEPMTPRLGEVRCPTLVMVGDEDKPFLEAAIVMERGIPGARRVVIPAAGHSPQLEAPRAWREAIEAHLRRARS
jgi:2-succinyl-6-hydroxy-2,4-cyclohexadiene-1-carboxylate synthase